MGGRRKWEGIRDRGGQKAETGREGRLKEEDEE